MLQLSVEPLPKLTVLTVTALHHFPGFLGLPPLAQTAAVGLCYSMPPTTQCELGASFYCLHLDNREGVYVLHVGDCFQIQIELHKIDFYTV